MKLILVGLGLCALGWGQDDTGTVTAVVPTPQVTLTVKSFAPGDHIKGKLADLIIIAEKDKPGAPWSIAVVSHDKEATDFTAEVFYQTTIPQISEKVQLHVTLNGPAYFEQAVISERNAEIPLADVREIRVRLLKQTGESRVRITQ